MNLSLLSQLEQERDAIEQQKKELEREIELSLSVTKSDVPPSDEDVARAILLAEKKEIVNECSEISRTVIYSEEELEQIRNDEKLALWLEQWRKDEELALQLQQDEKLAIELDKKEKAEAPKAETPKQPLPNSTKKHAIKIHRKKCACGIRTNLHLIQIHDLHCGCSKFGVRWQ
jgi:hypothetical protein